MLRPLVSNPVRQPWFQRAVALVLTLAAGTGFADGQTPAPKIVRIEQDWEIVIKRPNAAVSSPQISLWIKPDPAVDYGFLVQVNYRDNPTYAGGGLQVQGWDKTTRTGNKELVAVPIPKDETITLSTFMEVKDGKYSFGVYDGKSTTLGDLGKTPLVVTLPTTLTDLSKYSTDDTVKNTGVVYGADRVDRLKIKQVRKYDETGAKDNAVGIEIPIPGSR